MTSSTLEGPSALDLNPKKTAILCLDVQPFIIGMVPGSHECLPVILRLIDAGVKAGCPSAYVRVAFNDKEWAQIGPNTKNFYALKQRFGGGDKAPDMIHVDSESTALHPEVVKRIRPQQDIVVRKSRFGVFSTTDLHDQLKARNVDTLVIAGFKTSGAVLSAVRFAADHDYKIIVVREGVTDPDPQCHEVLVDKIFPEQGHVVGIADIEQAMQQSQVA